MEPTLDKNETVQEQVAVAVTTSILPKRPYAAPVLQSFGDVRSLTLGGTPGTGDSAGDPTSQKQRTF